MISLSGCTTTESYRVFRESHGTIQPQMTFKEVFEHGLADYLIIMKVKNIPGVTLVENRPVSEGCTWHVFDISYQLVMPDAGVFSIRIYCNHNLPSSEQVLPEQFFNSKNAFLNALATTYKPWIRSMRFRIESPPKFIGGVYDYYEFTIDQNGRVSSVSAIASQ